jgi:predicted ATPase/transcriptional regulator with XRE-family HTH domain
MVYEASPTLASLIRRHRLTAGLSQENLSERSGLSVRTISDLERGLRLTPHPETTRMVADGLGLTGSERAILIAAARPELGGDPHQSPVSSLDAPVDTRATIPTVPDALIGRDQEIADLVSLLSLGAARLITLTGPGGVGKTRLALAVAWDVAPAFAGGSTFVALAQVRDPALVIPTVAHVLGVRESADQPLLDRVCAALSNRATLLVLDNMEQILDAATDVAALLAGAPNLRLLVTSRGALRLSGEHRFPVRVLQLPAPGSAATLDEVAATEAIALFITRAKMAQPGFALTEANAPTIVEICRRLDGLPLAIELAAARIPLLPPAALLARMERRLPLLTGGARDLPARLQTMRAAIAWSYDLLTPSEQADFRRLAVFMGGFTLEAAEAVMAIGDEERAALDAPADPLDRIAALVERGLLWQSEQPDGDARFGMLETIREFGLEQLTASGEEETARRAHAHWYLSLAVDFEADGYAPSASTLNRMERELPNFRMALAWFESTEDAAMELLLAQSLFLVWHQRSHRDEGRSWLERALSRTPDTRSSVRAAALLELGLLEQNLARPERGFPYVVQGLELARGLDDRDNTLFAIRILAQFEVDDGDDERAWQLLDELESWGRQSDDPVDFPAVVSQLRGLLARRRGDRQRARSFLIDAFERSTTSGDIYERAIALELLGLVQCDSGEFTRAAASFLESLDDWKAVGTRESLIDWLAIVATLAEATGEPVRACRWFGAVEAHAEILAFNFPLPERREFARTAGRVRKGPADPNWTAGRNLSLDQATEEAAVWLRRWSRVQGQVLTADC